MDHVGLVRTVAVLDNVEGHFERNRPGEIGLPVAIDEKLSAVSQNQPLFRTENSSSGLPGCGINGACRTP